MATRVRHIRTTDPNDYDTSVAGPAGNTTDPTPAHTMPEGGRVATVSPVNARAFRFGLSVGGSVGRDDFVAAVRRAEDCGFDVIVAPDHIGSRLAVLPMLASAAQVSNSLRVSPMVMANDYRHPVIVAKDAATIDILSGGRFELGIATGWIEDQYQMAGIPYEPPRSRVDRFEEAIAVIKGSWSGEPFNFNGDHYRVDALTCPRPIQRPHPPLLMAGSGPRMLRTAGREADIVSISPLTQGSTGFGKFANDVATSDDRVRAQIGWIRQGAGQRFDAIELSVMAHHVVATADADTAAAKVAAEVGVTPGEVLSSPHMLIGTAGQLVETLLDRRERYGISYIIFGYNDLAAIQPVVEKLAN